MSDEQRAHSLTGTVNGTIVTAGVLGCAALGLAMIGLKALAH